jgi:hypothetical protein
MDKEAALQLKRSEVLSLGARYGLRQIRVFGSVARRQADDASDIDFLVEPGPEVSVLDLGGFLSELQQLLGCKVNVVTEKGLHPRIREQVLREAVPL